MTVTWDSDADPRCTSTHLHDGVLLTCQDPAGHDGRHGCWVDPFSNAPITWENDMTTLPFERLYHDWLGSTDWLIDAPPHVYHSRVYRVRPEGGEVLMDSLCGNPYEGDDWQLTDPWVHDLPTGIILTADDVAALIAEDDES